MQKYHPHHPSDHLIDTLDLQIKCILTIYLLVSIVFAALAFFG